MQFILAGQGTHGSHCRPGRSMRLLPFAAVAG